MTESAMFADAMALRIVADGDNGPVYDGELNSHWTIGPKVHGGVMVALCAQAAHLALGHGQDTAPGAAKPIAVSASFLWAPEPGPMRLACSVRKRGRQVSLVDVELTQGDRTAVRAAVTLGVPEHRVEPLLSVNPVVAQMAPEPPPDVEPIGPGHPMAEINHMYAGCDIRPDLSGLVPPDPGTAPVTRIWIRPHGQAPDALFALLCGDMAVPVSFAVNRTGWAPTVQLTAYVRSLPADGWLRVWCSTTQIGQDWFDEDHTVVDCEGRIVVQTRQLALVPAS
jgi:hypothetical protein